MQNTKILEVFPKHLSNFKQVVKYTKVYQYIVFDQKKKKKSTQLQMSFIPRSQVSFPPSQKWLLLTVLVEIQQRPLLCVDIVYTFMWHI